MTMRLAPNISPSICADGCEAYACRVCPIYVLGDYSEPAFMNNRISIEIVRRLVAVNRIIRYDISNDRPVEDCDFDDEQESQQCRGQFVG